ncbi:MAG: hypothetical protein ABSA30_04185 [Candidatus Aminicenantales bacterium]|jgi:hypothetical protein
MSERDRYFQEISRAFLARRGAPFFLSPKDLGLIASWEKAGVPLTVVLEGIDRAFAPASAGRRPGGKVLALAYCRNQVGKLFELRRDRRVGTSARGLPGREEKRLRALAEIDEFLIRGDAMPGLPAIALRAKDVLAAENPDEEALDRLDEEADAALAGDAAERERTRRIKALREKYRLPYFALFYY